MKITTQYFISVTLLVIALAIVGIYFELRYMNSKGSNDFINTSLPPTKVSLSANVPPTQNVRILYPTETITTDAYGQIEAIPVVIINPNN